MPYSYTNRKGATYYLHATTTKKGTVRYAMSRSEDGAIDELPEEYEVAENPNGRVSVRLAKPRLILPEEEALVKSALDGFGMKYCRIGIKGKEITVFEPEGDIDDAAFSFTYFDTYPAIISEPLEKVARETFGDDVINNFIQEDQEKRRSMIEKFAYVHPILRFTLQDKKKRLFTVFRVTLLDASGWQCLSTLPLAKAVNKYIPHLGKDSLFDLT